MAEEVGNRWWVAHAWREAGENWWAVTTMYDGGGIFISMLALSWYARGAACVEGTRTCRRWRGSHTVQWLSRRGDVQQWCVYFAMPFVTLMMPAWYDCACL